MTHEDETYRIVSAAEELEKRTQGITPDLDDIPPFQTMPFPWKLLFERLGDYLVSRVENADVDDSHREQIVREHDRVKVEYLH